MEISDKIETLAEKEVIFTFITERMDELREQIINRIDVEKGEINDRLDTIVKKHLVRPGHIGP